MVNSGVQQALGTKESIVTLRTSRTSSTVGFNQDYLSKSIITLFYYYLLIGKDLDENIAG